VTQGERRPAAAALEVKQCQPAEEQLLVDHALAEAGGDAKADALGQRLDHGRHVALVARGDRRQAIAHHHPVDRAAALDGAQLALLPHRFGINRRTHDLERVGIDARQEVEVDEAVVERRQERVGPRMGEPAEMGVAAGRVDDHEIDLVDHLLERGIEARLLVGLGGGAVGQRRERHRQVHRHGQRDRLALGIGRAIFDVAAERGLPRIEVERGHPRALGEQRHGDVQGGRRLARAALLVADHHHMGATRQLRSLALGDARIRSGLKVGVHCSLGPRGCPQ